MTKSYQADKITALTSAAGIDVEPIWASLLAKALEGKNVKELLSNVGSGGGAPAAGGAAPSASAGGAADAPKEEEKEEEKEESDEDMVRFLDTLMSLSYSDLMCVGFRSLRLSAYRVFCFVFIMWPKFQKHPQTHACPTMSYVSTPMFCTFRSITISSTRERHLLM